MGWITRQDLRLYLELRRHRPSPRWERVLRIYTRIGDGYLCAVVLLILWLSHPWVLLAPILGEALFTAALSLALYWMLKLTFRRPRPSEVFERVVAEVPPLDRWSFPSGHVMNNLSVALSLCYHFPLLGTTATLVPLSWGVLRVYFGVHYVSDILGGFVLALGCAVLGGQLYPLMPWVL